MKLNLILSFFIVSFLLLTGCTEKEKKAEGISWMDYNEGVKKSVEEGKPVLVDFYATWCGPCRMMDEITYEDEKVIEEILKNFIPVKVDVDKEQGLAYQYGVHSIPTIVYLDKNGNEIYRTVGYRSPSDILADMNKALSKIS